MLPYEVVECCRWSSKRGCVPGVLIAAVCQMVEMNANLFIESVKMFD